MRLVLRMVFNKASPHPRDAFFFWSPHRLSGHRAELSRLILATIILRRHDQDRA